MRLSSVSLVAADICFVIQVLGACSNSTINGKGWLSEITTEGNIKTVRTLSVLDPMSKEICLWGMWKMGKGYRT